VRILPLQIKITWRHLFASGLTNLFDSGGVRWEANEHCCVRLPFNITPHISDIAILFSHIHVYGQALSGM
jgi:hypothetical protein